MDDISVSFVELIALTRITPDATVEKFGALINSSFFDASNILATLKQKGLVDFVTAFPSQSTLKVTEKGNALLAECAKRSSEPIDQLDIAILAQLANGRRILVELSGALNVAQKDLAVHLYKLALQQNITYELVNASVSMYLTEKGFMAAKGGAAAQQAPAPQMSQMPPPMPQMQQAPQVPQMQMQPQAQMEVQTPELQIGGVTMEGVNDEIKILEDISRKRKRQRKIMIIGGIVVVIAVVAVLVLNFGV